jgi:hypothetical protein
VIFLLYDESKQQFMVDTDTGHRTVRKRRRPAQLFSANGRTIPCWGSVRHCLTFRLRTFFITFLLAAVYRHILSLDFLSTHGLLVNPVSRQVLDSKSLKLLSKPSTAAGTLRSKFAPPSAP